MSECKHEWVGLVIPVCSGCGKYAHDVRITALEQKLADADAEWELMNAAHADARATLEQKLADALAPRESQSRHCPECVRLQAERDLMARAIESAGALAGTSGGKPFLDVPELDDLRATVERVRRDCERHEETEREGIMPGHVNDALFVTYVKAAVVPGYLDELRDAMLEDRVSAAEPTGRGGEHGN